MVYPYIVRNDFSWAESASLVVIIGIGTFAEYFFGITYKTFLMANQSMYILFRIQEAEERRLRLYEDYKAEILDEDEYSQLKEHYIAEKQRLEHELQKQRQRALELEKRIKICDAQMERMRGILNQNEFDEELVHELIKRIYVGMDNSVEVEFKCSDPYQEVLAIMSEVQNE